jgi:hypothetical protein
MGTNVNPQLTFYRMPDAYATANDTGGVLNAVYNSLTSSVDYRGTALSSSHLWTWATASTGITNAVYNTALPTGSTLNNFAILFGGSSSAGGTMLSPQTDTTNVTKAGFIIDPGSYSNWTTNDPMTSGWFSGFWKLTNFLSNTGSTYVRTYVSQESIFVRVFQAGVATNQLWLYIGAIIEPYLDYTSSYNYNSNTDSRILGMISNGGAVNGNGYLGTVSTNYFFTNNAGDNQALAVCMRLGSPMYATTGIQRTTLPTNSIATLGYEKDAAGNWIFDEINFYNVINIHKVGLLRGISAAGLHDAGTNTLRSGSTDLYHLLSYNPAASSQTIVLKAAP